MKWLVGPIPLGNNMSGGIVMLDFSKPLKTKEKMKKYTWKVHSSSGYKSAGSVKARNMKEAVRKSYDDYLTNWAKDFDETYTHTPRMFVVLSGK